LQIVATYLQRYFAGILQYRLTSILINAELFATLLQIVSLFLSWRATYVEVASYLYESFVGMLAFGYLCVRRR
jgi:hypothetical protein